MSLLVHGALGFGVAGVDAAPPQRNRPVVISVEEIEAEEPEPPEPEKPKPAPEKPQPEPEAKPIETKPPPTPKPAARKAAPASDAPASSDASGGGDEIFDGGEMGGGIGTPVPGGNAGAGPRNDEPPPREKKVAKAKSLGATPRAATSGCDEKPGKPKPLEIPEPQYTERARAAGVEGAVRVEVTVDAKGRVTKVKVLRPLDPDLDTAAKKAIEQARFEPALACGKPVDSTFTISVKFSL